jgi:hypothetical protein
MISVSNFIPSFIYSNKKEDKAPLRKLTEMGYCNSMMGLRRTQLQSAEAGLKHATESLKSKVSQGNPDYSIEKMDVIRGRDLLETRIQQFKQSAEDLMNACNRKNESNSAFVTPRHLQ